MLRAALVILLLATVLAPQAQASSLCVIHGREIRNREHVSCHQARSIAGRFFSALHTPGWQCQGYKGQLWRGYCETNSGRSYFSWRILD